MPKKIDVNSTQTVTGSRRPQEDEVAYPDIDLKIKGGAGFTRKNGQLY